MADQGLPWVRFRGPKEPCAVRFAALSGPNWYIRRGAAGAGVQQAGSGLAGLWTAIVAPRWRFAERPVLAE